MLEVPDSPTVNASTSKLKFIFPWRPEQQRVLDRLNDYMDDKRIHIVAAPGAGKTVLGLEVFNRLDMKTLALSPTVLVKDQWIDRLSLFSNKIPNWVSPSLHSPAYFTSSTYQSLYSLDKQFKKNLVSTPSKTNPATSKYKDLKEWFRGEKIQLLILDEAHHLKASWWAVLYDLVKDNKNLIVVSLTATPPYDSNTTEWSRYKKLCGPVDEEISIPELVKSRSLCPHQDYIWLVKTDQKNIKSLERYEKNIKNFLSELNTHQELNYLLSLHEFLNEEVLEKNINERQLLLNIETVIALLQLQKHWQKPLPKTLLQLLDIDEEEIPAMTANSWEVLLQSFIEGSYYPSAEVVLEFRNSLISLLKGKHFLKYNRVQFDNTQSKLEAFNKTEERIAACYDIAKIEVDNRKSLLRMVVLADYIRDEELTLSLDGKGATTGAYPIFHYFIHQFDNVIRPKIALLTGRLCILPRHLQDNLLELLPVDNAPTIRDYSEHKDFVVCGAATGQLSAAYTKLLEQGELQIIVGTRALLGEGWDAPFLNSLVMATQTKAYVATNQLRGRVMRIDPNDDFKTASVWHIIATAPDQRFNKLIFENLKKRFRTFAGLHAYDLKIESGTERIQLRNTLIENENENNYSESTEKEKPSAKSLIQQNNETMQTRLKDDLFNLQARWQNALAQAKQQVFQLGLHHAPHDNSSDYSLNRLFDAIHQDRKRRTKLSTSVGVTGLFTLSGVALLFDSINTYILGAGIAGFGALSFGIIDKVTGRKNLDTLEISKGIARTILTCLHSKGMMKTELLEDSWDEIINIRVLDNEVLRFSLSAYTRQENEMFLEVLNEFLQPLSSGRYLLVLKDKPSIQDLFTIPKLLGNNKKDADAFLLQWKANFPEFKKAKTIKSNDMTSEKLLLKASAKRLLREEMLEEKIQMIETWE